MSKTLLSLKEIAKSLNLSVATVNYYTNLGLLRVEVRKGNSRLYNRQATFAQIKKIKTLRSAGYSLGLIQKKLSGRV